MIRASNEVLLRGFVAFHRSVAVAFKPGKALVQINDVVVRELCEGR